MIERVPPTTSGDWKEMREKLRRIIQAEVAKSNPTDDARRPLELIVETSVRYAEADGEARITVVDDTGRPRVSQTDGKAVPFTLQDLIEELRRDHPILFRSQDGPPSEETGEPPDDGQTSRDWLDVGSHGFGVERTRPALLARLTRLGRRRKGLTEGRDGTGGIASGAAESSGQSIRSRETTDPGRRKRWARPGAAIGTAALATGLVLGTVTLVRDNPTPENHEGPTATGAVPALQNGDPMRLGASPPIQRTLRGVPEVIDTATLSLEGEVIRLFGVEWAPGAGKPDDLTRYIQGREVVCEPAGPNDTYRCQVAGQDLSRVVLFNGGGKATPEATADLKAVAERAREAGVGVWNQ